MNQTFLEYKYDPVKVNQFIKTLFINTEDIIDTELGDDNKLLLDTNTNIAVNNKQIIVLSNTLKKDIYYISYGYSNKWIIYHSNQELKNIQIETDNPYFSEKRQNIYSYLAIANLAVNEGITFKIIQEISKYGVNNFCYTNLNNQIGDYYLFNINGGLVHINPSNGIDLVMLGICHTDNANTLITSCFNDDAYDSCQEALTNLRYRYNKASNKLINEYYFERTMPNIIIFDRIYQKIKKYDYHFYLKNLNLQSEKMFSLFPIAMSNTDLNSERYQASIINFYTQIRYSIFREISLVYRWFVKHKKAKEDLLRCYPNHAYVKLLQEIDKHYLLNKIDYRQTENLITLFKENNNLNDCMQYNTITTLMMDAMRDRSLIIDYCYDLYAIQKTKSYFPFLVFSLELIIFEFILNN